MEPTNLFSKDIPYHKPMWFLKKPSTAQLKDLLGKSQTTPFSYSEVGATVGPLPKNYWTDTVTVDLGNGQEAFTRAKVALSALRMFDNGVTELYPPTATVAPDQVVLVQLQVFGLWSVNPCRMVYVVDQPQRFGFAYGTLPGHAEHGEEVFLVEQGPTGKVWFETTAFSKPQELLAKVGRAYAWQLQRRVKRLYLEGMLKAIR